MGLDVSHVVPSLDTSKDGLLEYFTIEELSAFPDYIERHNHLIVEKEEDEGKVSVIYFKELGFQRKGMNSKFYKDFENGKPYLDIETVKKACKYLQADHLSSLKELQQNFQKNFIDSFVEGESIFYASW
jgi:hypothetical protein